MVECKRESNKISVSTYCLRPEREVLGMSKKVLAITIAVMLAVSCLPATARGPQLPQAVNPPQALKRQKPLKLLKAQMTSRSSRQRKQMCRPLKRSRKPDPKRKPDPQRQPDPQRKQQRKRTAALWTTPQERPDRISIWKVSSLLICPQNLRTISPCMSTRTRS